jgi:ATP-dependent exoDNAse (exonuclease V) alpha subunit
LLLLTIDYSTFLYTFFSTGNYWPRDEALYLIAQHMHETGRLVAEPGGDLISSSNYTSSTATSKSSSSSKKSSAGKSENLVLLNKDGGGGGAMVDETLKMMVTQRLTGATSQQITSMFDVHGVDLPQILNLPTIDAVRELARCKRIGSKTAEKIKLQWDAWVDQTTSINAASSATRFGLQLSDLEDTPPNLPFEWGPDVRCYLPRLHKAEVAVAHAAGEKLALVKKPSAARTTRIKKWISANQNTNGVELSQGQCAAIEAASDAPLLVITGGPGCGKTTVVQAIVKLWSAQGKTVHIAAPTGRAAQRMGVIQGIEPSTIHRLLKFQPRGENSSNTTAAAGAGNTGDGGDGTAGSTSADGTASNEVSMNGDEFDSGPGGFFELGAFNKLNSDAVLVDEASMLSLPLAAALMQALEARTQLILIGDYDQLPPIGAGGVLHSLISSKIAPVVDLREIFRQAAKSSIVTGALAVRLGGVPKLRHANPIANELLNADTDALIVRSPDADSVPELVYQTVGALAGDESFIESDLQVITPMRKGPTGSAALNLKLQNLLNPPEDGKQEVSRGAHGPSAHASLSAPSASGGGGERVFRVGDRVLQLVNNYDKDVFNGDQGYIIEVYPRERRLVVDFPQSGGRGDADKASTREYQGMELGQLELAYAITVHKAQGGEAKHVVMALSPQHGRMLTRQLLYTGMTRAKELLVVVAPGSGSSGGASNNNNFSSSSSSMCPLVTAVRHKDSGVGLSSLTARLEQERDGRGLVSHSPEVFSNEEEVLQGNLDAALDDSSSIPTPIETSSSSSFSTATTKKKESAPVVQEVVTLPMLCQDLGLSTSETENVVSTLGSTIDAQQASLVSASTVQAHLAKLQAVCEKKGLGSLPELSRVLRLAPLLLVASAEYFDRGLNFSEKFGPLQVVAETENSIDQQGGEGQTDDSLVDQLRRVLGAASSS